MTQLLHPSATCKSFVYVVLKDQQGSAWSAANVVEILSPPVWDKDAECEINTLPKNIRAFCFVQMLPAPAPAHSYSVGYCSSVQPSTSVPGDQPAYEYHGWVDTDLKPQAIRAKFEKNWLTSHMKVSVSNDLISLQQAMALTFQGRGRVFKKLPPRIMCLSGSVGQFCPGVPILSDMGVWQSLPFELPYGSLDVGPVLRQALDSVNMRISTTQQAQDSVQVHITVRNLLHLGHDRVWQFWQQEWPSGFTMAKKGMSNFATACFLGAKDCKITALTPPPSVPGCHTSADESAGAAITTEPTHRTKRTRSTTARTSSSGGGCADDDVASPPPARRCLLRSADLNLDALTERLENVEAKLDSTLTKIGYMATNISSMQATLLSISQMLQSQAKQ